MAQFGEEQNAFEHKGHFDVEMNPEIGLWGKGVKVAVKLQILLFAHFLGTALPEWLLAVGDFFVDLNRHRQKVAVFFDEMLNPGLFGKFQLIVKQKEFDFSAVALALTGM